MMTTTSDDRQKELNTLLNAMKAHPERDWSAERERVNVLREMLSHQGASAG